MKIEEMDDALLQSRLEPLARAAFKDFGLKNVKVSSAFDHDGDPVIKIDVTLDSSTTKYLPETVTGLTRDILAELREAGDERFPLVWVRYPSDEPQEDFYPDEKPRARRRS
ncbi:MAG TPA: hypothetical protein VGN97_18410 [Mesorhizobium sp.]|jgi:hypothetical protein|nr:hypothetical protein [Mesorhizobium sp.]